MNYNIILNLFNYQPKFKEIKFIVRIFSRDFPKFAKPLSVNFVFLQKHKMSASA